MTLLGAALLPLSLETVTAQEPMEQHAGQSASDLPHDEQSYRNRMFKAIEPVDDLATRLKTSGYDRYENALGIYFKKGEKVAVTLEKKPDANVVINIANFSDGVTSGIALREGRNDITIDRDGLGYISYESKDYKSLPPIRITVEGGTVNGIFALPQSNDVWREVLENAKAPYIDLYGRYVHLVYPVDVLRDHCPTMMVELLGIYDTLISAQQKVIGIGYKDERPPHHMFARIVPKFPFPHADGIGVGFPTGGIVDVVSIWKILSPDRISGGLWAIGHEFGHVNQTRPGFRWHGTVEVTNNLLAMVSSYTLDPFLLRLERDIQNDGKQSLFGGTYNKFTRSALVNGELWSQQAMGDSGHPNAGGGDVFVRLVPLWQLYLYTQVAGLGNPDFYPEFHLWLRENDTSQAAAGQHQLNFIKMACEINKQDLTDYFEAVGMLKPINLEFMDYGKGRVTITQEDCDEVKKFAAQYPKPETGLIQYLNANNVHCYKGRLPLTGPDKPGEGVARWQDTEAMIVSHAVWKNAVAFETYAGDKLVDITLAGVGSLDGKSVTNVYFPTEATEIKAVGWNGERKTAYVEKK